MKPQDGIPIKLQGINAWFIIEILSFYGYIISAIWFIMENSVRSTFGWLDKTNLKERYKTDFIVFHRQEIDWLAFLTILLLVNSGLLAIEELVILKGIPLDQRGD
jgi:hypothetical protein